MSTRKARRNPPLVIFGNPGGRNDLKGWTKIATDVQAIAYKHAQDGCYYAHGFGGKDIPQQDLDEDMIDLAKLASRTGVEAFWSPDGKTVVLRHRQGKRIVGLY